MVIRNMRRIKMCRSSKIYRRDHFLTLDYSGSEVVWLEVSVMYACSMYRFHC
tara:strand:+ start:107001 stop:107156 length:156 start_codon:yes stop_codon:yes gene_type:complete